MDGAGAPDDLQEGHRTQAGLASAPERETGPRTGGNWRQRGPREPHAVTRDLQFQRRVLAHLEGLTGVGIDGPV